MPFAAYPASLRSSVFHGALRLRLTFSPVVGKTSRVFGHNLLTLIRSLLWHSPQQQTILTLIHTINL